MMLPIIKTVKRRKTSKINNVSKMIEPAESKINNLELFNLSVS